MNEAETRAALIDPKLKACGWGLDVICISPFLRCYHFLPLCHLLNALLFKFTKSPRITYIYYRQEFISFHNLCFVHRSFLSVKYSS